ncbi:hypothetical protein [Pseudomonas sp. DWR1-3-2b2]|uniref:hypothetical protein n=1 Tax=unclassified Pseudomonas TaxID=196821 RepID=UPI003CF8D883
MLYLLFLLAHLFAALIFIGTVFFEVLILARLHPQLPARVMVRVEQGVGQRAKVLMPWVLLVLFGAGLGMVWLRYLPALGAPFASSFGTLLTLKLILAASVLLHFLLTMLRMRRGRAGPGYLRFVHLSLFGHMVAIVVLAKSMFYLTW